MVNNLPLLLSMLAIGMGILTISQTTQMPEPLHWVLIITAVILSITSAIGLIVHVGMQKANEN